MISFLIMTLFIYIAYSIIFFFIRLVLLRKGYIRCEMTVLEEANFFLLKWLSRKEKVAAICPLSILSMFEKAYYGCIAFVYEMKFQSYPPLIPPLYYFKEDNPFNTVNLLRSLSPIIKLALRKEGVGTNPHFEEEHALITCGDKEGNNSFFSKQKFYSKLDDYILANPDNIIWATGEFGMLEDQKFLDVLEACKDITVSILGHIKGVPTKIDEFLDKFFKISAEEGKILNKQTEYKRRTQIKRLFENKKLSLFVTPDRIIVPHMAVIGDSVFIQQRHTHNKGSDKIPVAVIFLKHPSKNLRLFINNYLQELKKSIEPKEVK